MGSDEEGREGAVATRPRSRGDGIAARGLGAQAPDAGSGSAVKSGWVSKAQQSGGAARGRRLLFALQRMLEQHEALSMRIGEPGYVKVVGAVFGRRDQCIKLECGRQDLLLADRDLEWVEERGDEVEVRGRFEGGVIRFRAYEMRENAGREAAKTCGGEAGWVCETLDTMRETLEPGQWLAVLIDGERPEKLQWVEFDKSNGEIVLMAGRLDQLRQIRLRSDRLDRATFENDSLIAEGFRSTTIKVSPAGHNDTP